MVLAIRTDKPEAELYLCKGQDVVAEHKWQAHRALADTIHLKIDELLKGNKIDYKDLTGLVVYQGPGSFTGLRIGLTVFNTIAYSQSIPIVGAKTEDWLELGIKALQGGVNHKIVMPFYGGEANISTPKK